MAPTPADPPPAALDDAGTTQALLALGWIPPAVTALVCGVIVAVLRSDFSALVIVVVAGTVVGYIVCLALLFTVGFRLSQRKVGASTTDRFVKSVTWSGVPVAIAMAILVLIAPPTALAATVVAIGAVVLAVVYLIITDDRDPGSDGGNEGGSR